MPSSDTVERRLAIGAEINRLQGPPWAQSPPIISRDFGTSWWRLADTLHQAAILWKERCCLQSQVRIFRRLRNGMRHVLSRRIGTECEKLIARRFAPDHVSQMRSNNRK